MDHLKVVLLGKTGSGKSASGNTILGQPSFRSGRRSNSTTKEVQQKNGTFCGVNLTVYDTPGLCNTEGSREETLKEIQTVLKLPGPVVFLLVIKADRFTAEERIAVEETETLLGQERLKNTWILFTRGDELEEEGQTIKDFIRDTEELNKVVQRFQSRYHLFNNKVKNENQVKELLDKIKSVLKQSDDQDEQRDSEDIRIVLLGKTGSGKSATGNTILGEEKFESMASLCPVTKHCEAHESYVWGRRVKMIEVPGLYDTNLSKDQLAEEIGKSIFESCPGPHAFLFFVPLSNRFTEQEVEVFRACKKFFGKDMVNYVIILFTHGEKLSGEKIKSEIDKNTLLQKVIEECKGRYHIIANEDKRNRQQVTNLLEKIVTMMEDNLSEYYTNEMYEEAKRSTLVRLLNRFKNHFLEFVSCLFCCLSPRTDSPPIPLRRQYKKLN